MYHSLLLPDLARLRAHFALPALIALAAALLVIADPMSDIVARPLVALGAAFPAALAAGLFAQSRSLASTYERILQFAAACLAGALTWFSKDVALSEPALLGALALACIAAPVGGFRSAESYWVWAERFCTVAAFAGAAGLIGWGATTATLASADYLFHLDLPYFVWRIVMALFLIAGAPILFVALQPLLEEARFEAGAKDLIRRAIGALSVWAMAPFVLIYSALLWLYAGKIALLRDLPDGEIGAMVGAFGVAAIATIFLVFPERSSRPHVGLLWRVWPFLAVVPLTLLGFAIEERVAAYGLTTDRYLATLLAALCALTAAVAMLSRDVVIRFAPAAGALGLLAASFGPWGARATAVRWQEASLRDVYAAHAQIKDGLLVIADKAPEMTAPEARRCRSAVQFLRSENRLDAILAPHDDKTGALEKRLCADNDASEYPRHRNYYSHASWTPQQPLQNVTVIAYLKLHPSDTSNIGDAKVEFLDDRFVVSWRGQSARFDFVDIEKRFDANGKLADAPLLKPTSGDDKLFFLVGGMGLQKNADGSVKFHYLDGYLMRRE